MRLIDADALKQEIREAIKHLRNYQGVAICLKALNDAPTIEAKPVRHGRWITHFNAYGLNIKECSQCGHYRSVGTDGNYCANCGARMGGGAEK